jgi:TolB-like protein
MLEFRVGINSGDLVKEKENLLGDGVNIAARLEALAQTGGVTISKVIYDFVKGKTAYEFYDLGLQKIKQNEFHAFDLLLETSQKRKIKSDRYISKLYLLIAFAAVLAFGAVIFLSVFDMGTKEQVYSDDQLATVKSSSPVMLVYPFENLSSSEKGENFSDAITESMISSLSRYKGISVLSSSTSSDAKSKQFSDASIKKFYNANFIVRGSIQTLSNQSRIQMELTDLSLNRVVWTDKVDFAAEDIFRVQDKIGDKILTHLQINAVAGSEVKSWAAKYGTTERLTLFLNSREEWFKFTPDAYENHTSIIKILEEQLGEESSVLYNIKGWNLILKITVGKSTDVSKDAAELIRLADLDISENNDVTSYNLRALVEFRVGSKDCEKSKQYAKKAAELGATADTYIVSGSIWVECGDLKEGTRFFEKALRLQPNDSGWNLTKRLIPMYYLQEEYSKIVSLVEPHLDAIDVAPEMIAFYAFSKLLDGDKNLAKTMFDRAKTRGISKQTLERVIRDPSKTKEFILKLSELGTIE